MEYKFKNIGVIIMNFNLIIDSYRIIKDNEIDAYFEQFITPIK